MKADPIAEPTSEETLEEFQDSLKEIRLAQRREVRERSGGAFADRNSSKAHMPSLSKRYTEDEIV